jgi:hemolysin D
VHPAPRRLAYLLMGLFTLALVWSLIGEVDIVATAPGRIIVSDRTKVIQPLEASVVKAVLVKDGDRVQAGQVLVQLDPTIATADKANVQEQFKTAQNEQLRAEALLQLLNGQYKLEPILKTLEPAAALQLQSEWRDIQAKLTQQEAELKKRQAEVETVKASIAKLEATLPMAQKREADYNKLVDQGFISGHATQDKTRERIELEKDLVTYQAKLAEALANTAATEQARAAYKAETQRQLSDRQAQANTKRIQLSADNNKATQREKQTVLRAPVSGVVQQLAIHSVGGVVTSAQQLMVVVPDATQVTAEVAIANQDIGFVNAGQEVEIKLETFSFTKYGTIKAKVETVTADAVTDEKRGSFYPAILTLDRKDMLIDGKTIPISPGMNVTAEIKTGKRTLIEFLLSPVQKMASESLRER